MNSFVPYHRDYSLRVSFQKEHVSRCIEDGSGTKEHYRTCMLRAQHTKGRLGDVLFRYR
jgi:hypothetical protein